MPQACWRSEVPGSFQILPNLPIYWSPWLYLRLQVPQRLLKSQRNPEHQRAIAPQRAQASLRNKEFQRPRVPEGPRILKFPKQHQTAEELQNRSPNCDARHHFHYGHLCYRDPHLGSSAEVRGAVEEGVYSIWETYKGNYPRVYMSEVTWDINQWTVKVH